MEIHKPHAAKTWKEFFIELGTIVIGILIALGLEQAAEAVHDRSRSALAGENIRSEIASDIALMDTRATIESCISRRLDQVDELIRAAAVGALPKDAIWLGHPFLGGIINSRYLAATQSGAFSLLSNQEQAGYARIYAEFDQYQQAELVEQAAWADLRALEKHPTASPALDALFRSAVQKARLARFQMETGAVVARQDATMFGIRSVPSRRFVMQSACIPLNTERTEAGKMVVQGRRPVRKFDEP